MSAVTVRHATSEDAARCAPLIDEHSMFARYGWTVATLEEALAAATAARDLLLVAEAGGRPLGFVWCLPRGGFDRGGYVRLLVITASAVGTGVADRLMDVAESELFAHSHDVLLLVNEGNGRARRFYERRGYHRIGSLEAFVTAGETEIVYRKRRPR